MGPLSQPENFSFSYFRFCSLPPNFGSDLFKELMLVFTCLGNSTILNAQYLPMSCSKLISSSIPYPKGNVGAQAHL